MVVKFIMPAQMIAIGFCYVLINGLFLKQILGLAYCASWASVRLLHCIVYNVQLYEIILCNIQ